MIKTLVGGALAAVVTAVLVQILPDLRRYLRIRSM
ncbi:DUF6893 family small protein [Streptomyces sp. NPDC059837]|jgi:hypothetical protein|uniref:Uncharacterized protein n=1 Tax=Streptomyces olivochromogenes TaxID=1963 RepID=A0A250V5N9_STROL|nr:hypothetical protein BX281_1960 [Streptomyces sp. Ag82_O1-15]GAX49412.1 hypothetical protein SO3561_00901 [Streptomyces olivochromogenes]SOE52975.1 hypothetical protein SAMN05446589_0459 [Streptomyces sp. OV198]